ncbi:hypothetical protein SCUCBS95973_001073 [Sporothrix curviconia]|uniref:Uncharacterized protein n=1 Tax=Sporothrix curviconia TaxID=1260050 RepID=A0ABP0AVR0_9PEZI
MANNTANNTMLGHGAESSPEELLDVFKAAALSVTKLYKTSAAVQSKARIEGYQDCLEDLLTVLEKGDADVRTIRRWVVERLDGREPILSTIESEDEVEKTEGNATPEPQLASAAANTSGTSTSNNSSSSSSSSTSSNNNSNGAAASNSDTAMQTEVETETEMETEADATPSPAKNSRAIAASTMVAPALTKKSKSKARSAATATATTITTTTDTAPDTVESAAAHPPNVDQFSFRSSVPYPTESFLELANLDLSDRRSAPGSVKDASEPASSANGTSTFVFNAPSQTTASAETTSSSPSHTSNSRQFRLRHATGRPAVRNALTARMNRTSAGQKRKLNFDEIFDLASLGYGKDVFGRGGGKRSRQA